MPTQTGGVAAAPVAPDEVDPSTLVWGERLKVERARRGWTQRDLAEKADVPQQVVSSIERGRVCLQTHRLKDIARALRLHPDVIFPRRRRTDATVAEVRSAARPLARRRAS